MNQTPFSILPMHRKKVAGDYDTSIALLDPAGYKKKDYATTINWSFDTY